jgi:hypothetical protein
MKNAVFWDVALCRSCVNRRFGGTRRLHLQGRRIRERVCSVQPPAHAGSSLADYSTLKIETIRSSETSVHTRSTQGHIPQDGILHDSYLLGCFHWSHSIKPYISFPLFHVSGLYKPTPLCNWPELPVFHIQTFRPSAPRPQTPSVSVPPLM